MSLGIQVPLRIFVAGATLKVKLAVGFLGNGEMAGYELDIALLAMAVFIAINGSKMLALDQIVFKGQKTDYKAL